MKGLLDQQFITNNKGEKVAVIVSLIDFEKMKEDLHDLSVIARRKSESTISYEMLKSKFKK